MQLSVRARDARRFTAQNSKDQALGGRSRPESLRPAPTSAILNASLSEFMGRGTSPSAADKPRAEQPDIPHVDAPPPQQQQPWPQSETEEDAEITVTMRPSCLPANFGSERWMVGRAEDFAGSAEADALAACAIFAPW